MRGKRERKIPHEILKLSFVGQHFFRRSLLESKQLQHANGALFSYLQPFSFIRAHFLSNLRLTILPSVFETDQKLSVSNHIKSDKKHGCIKYTRFNDSYCKFGAAAPHSTTYKRLNPLRNAIERS